ncbi:hypothetical protein SLA2020_524420 [Shorea laevis]
MQKEETLIDFGGEESLLCGGEQLLYINSLSSREMESLTAICDTFLPSLDVDISAAGDDTGVADFFGSSASMTGTPERLGGLMSERLNHPKKWLIRMALWMLSTYIGTLILCGRRCLSTDFPFVLTFSQLPQQKKEEILRSWSTSCFHLLRMLFKAMKLLTLVIFFTQVDEKNENLSWKAIGYPGPDPDFKTQKGQRYKQNGEGNGKSKDEHVIDEKEELLGPLYRGIINLKHPREAVVDDLRRRGFPVSVCTKNTKPPAGLSNCPSFIIHCDAVVVGSGSGGGVVGGVLATAGYKVIVLEKGNYFARSNLSLLEGPSMDQMYLCGGMFATDDMGVAMLAGSTVGGGSAINWSASIKTPHHVLDEWSNQYDLELFDSKLYREAMDVVCNKMGVQSEVLEEGLNNAVLRKGCQELGYPVNNIPRNSTADHYCGWCCLGCKDGRKKGTSETWLVDLVDSGNGAILPGCDAFKVLNRRKNGRDRKRATGIAFQFECKGRKEICVVESRVTVIACGALSTPTLLKRSGLKNPNIGKNLHLHPVTMAWGYFPNNPGFLRVEKKSFEGGIMTAMSTVVANLDKCGYGAVLQTPSLHPGMFSGLMPWLSGADIKRRMCRFSRTAHLFALARDRGSGTVNSPNSISYKLESGDEHNLQKGLEKILRILNAAGAEEIGTHHNKGNSINAKEATSDEFEKFVKEESSRPLRNLSAPISSAHQMGSCRMGVDPRESVVNQMGETWEIEGLFIADASVFPTALGVNPMVTVQAISYCTAQSVLEFLRRKKSK